MCCLKGHQLGAAFSERKVKEKAVAQKKNEILVWLLFAKYVGDKPPNKIPNVFLIDK